MSTVVEARAAVAAVLDPELPMITIEDLGILRDVRVAGSENDEVVHVTITPTYAGCPAMETIADDIRAALEPQRVEVHTVLSPAWSTDDLTEAGRSKLAEAGIAPPGSSRKVGLTLAIRCPQCGSAETRELSRFGSTACKALWVCQSCREPFDSFKTH